MVIYEVTLEFLKEIEGEYRKWLTEHIEDMLALPGFEKAQCYEQMDFNEDPNSNCVVVHYHVASMKQLERYFANESPQMRGEALRLFPDQFRAKRRILHPDSSNFRHRASELSSNKTE